LKIISNLSGAMTALLAAALFGISTPLAKRLLGDGIDPWLLAGLLYAGCGIGLSVVYLLSRNRSAEASLSLIDLPRLSLVVLTGGIIAPVLMMSGLAQSSASAASLLLNLEGLATMAIAWLVFKEHVDRRLLIGAGSILAGAVLLSYRELAHFNLGALAIVAACIAWGVDNNLTRGLSGKSAVQIAAIKGLVAGSVNLILSMERHAAWPTFPQVSAALLLGLLSYGMSIVLFVFALRKLGTARTSAYFSTAPFLGAVLAVALLSDSVTLQMVSAALLMALGVYLHLTERHGHSHTHESLEHSHRHEHDLHHHHSHGPDDPPGEPHSHPHRHAPMTHRHLHYPDIHHRHSH
jgi:drug/metabolite transporter (DMT)-like permease